MNSSIWNEKLVFFASAFIILIFMWVFVQKPTNFLESSTGSFSTENMPLIGISLGQNFIVGIHGSEIDEATEKILRDIKPGGVVLYRRNYESPEQFKSLISTLQVIAKEDDGAPYFIMVDEEPNGASRLDLLKDVFTFHSTHILNSKSA